MAEPSDSGTALVLLNDLMFQVKIAEAARQSSLATTFVNTSARLLQLAAHEPPVLILIDLNLAAADPLALIRDLKREPGTKFIPLLGYVSHVQVELRTAASEAGCDVVLARSAFVQNLPELLTRYAVRNPTCEKEK